MGCLAGNVHVIISDATFQESKEKTGWDFMGWGGWFSLILFLITRWQNRGERPGTFICLNMLTRDNSLQISHPSTTNPALGLLFIVHLLSQGAFCHGSVHLGGVIGFAPSRNTPADVFSHD